MLIHFTSEGGKPLYNSKNDPEMAGPSVHYKEVPLYSLQFGDSKLEAVEAYLHS